ncbi:uncharacterized protein [Argopecten irradians]|uniref:uncharacterized protein isoform X2 n=1 Tax=Argopecten irradians TaxID=31199 RepID=UPI00371D5893
MRVCGVKMIFTVVIILLVSSQAVQSQEIKKKVTATEKETRIATQKRDARSTQVEISDVMVKFGTVETKMTSLSTEVASLKTDMKAMERIAVVLEMNATKIDEGIREARMKTEKLGELSREAMNRFEEIQAKTDMQSTLIGEMKSTFIERMMKLVDKVKEIKKRVNETENKQNETSMLLDAAISSIIDIQTMMKAGYSKDFYELPDTADTKDDGKTDDEKYEKTEFSSWEEVAHQLLEEHEHQIILWGLLAVLLSLHIPYCIQSTMEKYKWITPMQTTSQESKRHLSMEDIANLALQNQTRIDHQNTVLQANIDNNTDEVNTCIGMLGETRRKLEKDITTERNNIIILFDKFDDHKSSIIIMTGRLNEHEIKSTAIEHDMNLQKKFTSTLKDNISDQTKEMKETRQKVAELGNDLDRISTDLASMRDKLDIIEATQKTFVGEESFRKSEKNVKTEIQLQSLTIRRQMETDSKKSVSNTNMIIRHLDILKRSIGQYKLGIPGPNMPGLVKRLSQELEKHMSSSSESEDNKNATAALICLANAELERYTLSSSDGGSDGRLSDIDPRGQPLPMSNGPVYLQGEQIYSRTGNNTSHEFRGVPVVEDDSDEPETCEEEP